MCAYYQPPSRLLGGFNALNFEQQNIQEINQQVFYQGPTGPIGTGTTGPTGPMIALTSGTAWSMADDPGPDGYMIAPAYNVGTNNFTYEVWVYDQSDDSNPQSTVLDTRSLGYGIQMYIQYPQWVVYCQAANDNRIVSDKIPKHTWTNLALVRNGTDLYMYVNGNLELTWTDFSYDCSCDSITFGRNFDGGYSNNYVLISEFRASDVARYTDPTYQVATQIFATDGNTTSLYHFNNSYDDSSGNGNDITPHGQVLLIPYNTPFYNQWEVGQIDGPTGYTGPQGIPGSATITGATGPSGYGPTGETGPTGYGATGPMAFGLGNAWYFDGSTAVVTPSSIVFDIGTEFQVDAWICPTRLDDGDNCLWYFKYRENEHTWDNSMGTIQLRTDGGFDIVIANQPSWTVGVGLQKVNAWNHICLTLKDGFNYFYFNGVLVDSLANNRTYSERQVYLGVQKPDGYNNFYEGYISQFRFLTQVLYTTDFVPPLFVLEPTATTGLLTCQATELLDRSSNAFTLTLDAGTFTATQYIPYGAATGPTGPSGVSVADGTYSPVTSITILNGVITAIT